MKEIYLLVSECVLEGQGVLGDFPKNKKHWHVLFFSPSLDNQTLVGTNLNPPTYLANINAPRPQSPAAPYLTCPPRQKPLQNGSCCIISVSIHSSDW